MLAAYFMSCVVTTATGAVQCNNSYTEMDSAIGKGQTCEVVARQLHQISVDAVLMEHPGLIIVAQRTGCGTMAFVKAEAEKMHKEYQDAGIYSTVGQF